MTTIDVIGSVPRFPKREIAAFARRVLRVLKVDADDLAIAFVDDESMRKMNKTFRGKNKTTDVLTFPDEIVISIDQARRQAGDEKHSLAIEVRYLIAHGVLHALGYDHETDNGEMNALEMKVRRRVGLP